MSRPCHRHCSTPILIAVTMAGTWNGDTRAEGPTRDRALLSLWRPLHPKGPSVSSGQLKAHWGFLVEGDAGDAQRSLTWQLLGMWLFQKLVHGLDQSHVVHQEHPGRRKGWGHPSSPAKESMARPGSDTRSEMWWILYYQSQ